MTLLILAIKIKGIIGIILLIGLMFLSVKKIFTVGWKGMTNEQRMLSVISFLLLGIVLLITSIIIFN